MWDSIMSSELESDIAHAYQILTRRGVPAKNIVVMMVDDVAHHRRNPKPGTLINKPNGPNVYKGLKIDYKGSDVTPQVFLDVLSGNKKGVAGKGTRRVIESGPNDTIFVNFVDHGGPGILCFPYEDLSARNLVDTLKKMSKSKKFGKLLLYVETCYAGSVFDELLPQHTSILASTAAGADESSYASFCDYRDYPCLGDLYSVTWMQHMDKKIPYKENLFDQYQITRTNTSLSHVNLYGDFKVGLTLIKDFMGPNNNHNEGDNTSTEDVEYASVLSPDAELYWLKRMAENSNSKSNGTNYSRKATQILRKREFIDNIFDTIVLLIADGETSTKNEIEGSRAKLTMAMFDCYENVYRTFSKKCFNISKNSYVMRHFYKFVNICAMKNSNENAAIAAINRVCHSQFSLVEDTFNII